jgi:hypothetical protein
MQYNFVYFIDRSVMLWSTKEFGKKDHKYEFYLISLVYILSVGNKYMTVSIKISYSWKLI